MTSAENTGGQAAKWLRWIARGTGSFVAGFWLFVGIVAAIVESRPLTLEGVIMVRLIISSALSVLIAWWREGVGGAIVVVCAIAHSTFAYVASGHNEGLAMLISGGPFLLVGILFLASWWKSRIPQSKA